MDGLWMAWKEEIIMELHILQVGDVLVSPDIFTEKFCCDLDACKGACCIKDCCLCALEKAYRTGQTEFVKPISCALYPIREKQFAPNLYGLNYHRWKICAPGRKKGEELGLPLYRFLEGPLTRRFGKAWYEELCSIAKELGL